MDNGNNTGQISWIHPGLGEVALNRDGSVFQVGSQAACGGVVTDEAGNFLFAFAANPCSCSILEAELRGILHGLKIAWSSGVSEFNLIPRWRWD